MSRLQMVFFCFVLFVLKTEKIPEKRDEFFSGKIFSWKEKKNCIKKWQIVWKRKEKLLQKEKLFKNERRNCSKKEKRNCLKKRRRHCSKKKESRNYRNKEKWNYLCSTAQKMKFCIKDFFNKCHQNILVKYVTKISPFVLSRTSLSCVWQLFTSF